MNMAQAHGNMPMSPGHSHPELTAKGVALRMDMRKLWEDHVTWTRLAIISLEGGTPDTDATVGRLLQNQVDIGNAIKPYYGDAVGNALTGLLRRHILIAADVIAAAKAGNADQLARRAVPLGRERRPDRGCAPQSQPALLEAPRDEGDDAHAPRPDHAGGGCEAAG